MSVKKRIYVLLALSALGFAAACAEATAPDNSSNKTAIQRDGTQSCDQQGSTVKC